MGILITIILVISIELIFKPRIDVTEYDDVLLWFNNRKVRKWVKLFVLLIFLNVTVYAQQASYYANKFNGRKTASGTIFSNNELTCPHKTLPFGTILRVINVKNGKSVLVTVTDRGPFIKGRVIDLSQKAFKSIASLSSEYITVKIEKL